MSFAEFNPSQVDFSGDVQDNVIKLLITNTDFLRRCMRKGLEPDLFTSDIRQQLVAFVFEYFEKYNEAPDDNVSEILDLNRNGFRTKVREEDQEAMYNFIVSIYERKVSGGAERRLFDRINEFIEKRILHTTISRLYKAKDRVTGSPETLKAILQDANQRLSIQSSMDCTLGLLDEVDLEQSPWLTRFNIPAIDNAYGGGFTAPNLVVLQAFTGRGKTWSICHLAKVGLRLGNDVTALVTEMNAKKFLNRMRKSLTGMTTWEQNQNLAVVKERLEKSQVRGSKFNLISDQVKLDKDFAIDSLAGIVEEIEERRCRDQEIILIDSPDDMEPPADAGIDRSRGIDKSKAIYTWLRNYSQEKNKLIIVTSQSQRISETRLWTTAGNIGEDINKVRRATLGISINGQKSEVEAGFIRLLVFKNTYGPDGKAAWVETDFERGMFEKVSGEIKGFNLEDYKGMLLARGVSLGNRER